MSNSDGGKHYIQEFGSRRERQHRTEWGEEKMSNLKSAGNFAISKNVAQISLRKGL